MSAPRILVTGPEWFGDLLAYCQRGLEQLGANVRVAGTRLHAEPAPQWWRNQRLQRIPGIGWRLQDRMTRRDERARRAQALSTFRSTIRDWRPDLVISLLNWGDWLLHDAMDDLENIRKVGWLMDDPFQVDEELSKLLPRFDRLYVIDETWALPIRLMVDRAVDVLTCGADPQTQRPVSVVPKEFCGGVAFVGSSYYSQPSGPMRSHMLRSIADMDLRLFGDRGWTKDDVLAPKYRGGPLPSETTNLVYNGADIALNIHHPQFKAGTSLRTFAICAAGAFQIVDWRPGLDAFFIPGEELVTYSSLEELREQVARYAVDTQARLRIARAGGERARREHTYAHRLRVILEHMDLMPRVSLEPCVAGS
jgi:spore maturation protein CgeB